MTLQRNPDPEHGRPADPNWSKGGERCLCGEWLDFCAEYALIVDLERIWSLTPDLPLVPQDRGSDRIRPIYPDRLL